MLYPGQDALVPFGRKKFCLRVLLPHHPVSSSSGTATPSSRGRSPQPQPPFSTPPEWIVCPLTKRTENLELEARPVHLAEAQEPRVVGKGRVTESACGHSSFLS